jgi:hypothetical protein
LRASGLHVSDADLMGYLAAALVLGTFCMRDMLALRLTAVASNLAFIAYGLLADIGPVLTLHLLLLPINVVHLPSAARHHDLTRQRVPNAPRSETTGRPTRGCLNRNPEKAHHD